MWPFVEGNKKPRRGGVLFKHTKVYLIILLQRVYQQLRFLRDGF
jgi:hypothetical protein